MATTAPADVRDPDPPDAGPREIAWAEREMPVLRTIRGRFEVEQPLAGLRVAACLHVTAETAVLARTLVAGGADLVLVASDPLTTRADVAAVLARDPGIAVSADDAGGEAGRQSRIAAALKHRPQVTIDDGAELAGALSSIASGRLDGVAGEVRDWADALSADERAGLANDVAACVVGGAAGVACLRALERGGGLVLPVIAANDAPTRRLLDDRHGTGQGTLDGVLRATDLLIAGRRVVVCGFGDCGRGIARRASGLGARVVVAEVDPLRALEAALDGFEVMEIDRAAPVGDLFLTATGGAGVIRGEHFAAMKDGAIVGNAGHSDAELALGQLAEVAATRNEAVRPAVDEFVMPDGRRVYVLAAGRPVNLAAAHGHPASVMDVSFATQALAVEWSLRMKGQLAHEVYNVPREVDRWVAHLKLQSMGIAIDTLPPGQGKAVDRSTPGT